MAISPHPALTLVALGAACVASPCAAKPGHTTPTKTGKTNHTPPPTAKVRGLTHT